MDQKRQGEIALSVLKYYLRKRGINLSQDSMRDVGNVAKSIDISAEELKQFARPLVEALVDECFADSGIKITTRK